MNINYIFVYYFIILGLILYNYGISNNRININIFTKNLIIDIIISILLWWLIGYSISYNKSINGIIGNLNIPFIEYSTDMEKNEKWIEGIMKIIISLSIINYSFNININKISKLILLLVINIIIFPFIYYLLSENGLIYYYDDIFSSYIYIIVGLISLINNIFQNKNNKNTINDIKYVFLGIIIILSNWHALIYINLKNYNENQNYICFINIVLSTLSSSIIILFYNLCYCIKNEKFSYHLLESIFYNLITISYSMCFIKPLYSFIIGFISTFIYTILYFKLKKYMINLLFRNLYLIISGILGSIFLSIFKNETGIIYKKNINIFTNQIIGLLIIISITGISYTIISYILYKLNKLNFNINNENDVENYDNFKKYIDINKNNLEKNKNMIINVINEIENMKNGIIIKKRIILV